MQPLIKRILPCGARDVVDGEAALFPGGEGARGAVGEVVGFFVGAREAAGCARVVVVIAVAVGGGNVGGGVGRGEQEEGFLDDFFVEDGCCCLWGVGAREEGVGDVVGGLGGWGFHCVCGCLGQSELVVGFAMVGWSAWFTVSCFWHHCSGMFYDHDGAHINHHSDIPGDYI